MSSVKVGVRLPKFRRSSSSGVSTEGAGERALRDKDVNSIRGSDEGNGNNSSDSGKKTQDLSSGSKTIAEMSVYLGGSNLVIPSPTTAPSSTVESKNNANNTSNKINNSSNGLQYRKCCFFWSCCCSCSCLNIKHHNTEHLQPNNRIEHINGENDPPPSIEDIRAWGESFDCLMKCSVGRKAFREFLKCEYSEENILFWTACEELKREKNPLVVEEKARLIYEDYISILSPKEVSLDSRVREIINRNMVDPTTRTFDEAQTQIYTLMSRDSYPRFINSPHYKKLAQLNNNGSGGSGNRRESSAQ